MSDAASSGAPNRHRRQAGAITTRQGAEARIAAATNLIKAAEPGLRAFFDSLIAEHRPRMSRVTRPSRSPLSPASCLNVRN